MSKKDNVREYLFRHKFDQNREVRLFRNEKKFFIERIHCKFSMSSDSFDDPEIAYYYYNLLISNQSTRYPVDVMPV